MEWWCAKGRYFVVWSRKLSACSGMPYTCSTPGNEMSIATALGPAAKTHSKNTLSEGERRREGEEEGEGEGKEEGEGEGERKRPPLLAKAYTYINESV